MIGELLYHLHRHFRLVVVVGGVACLGLTGAPFDSYLALRGVRTLHVRMRQHLENAASVVDALGRHEAVEALQGKELEGRTISAEKARRRRR